jgi:hypothetical protein
MHRSTKTDKWENPPGHDIRALQQMMDSYSDIGDDYDDSYACGMTEAQWKKVWSKMTPEDVVLLHTKGFKLLKLSVPKTNLLRGKQQVAFWREEAEEIKGDC